jgi:carbonic anhydrase
VLVPDPINKVFTVQNIGNQIQVSEGSVDYGVYHLKTPLLMVLGHSGCGAITAAIDGYNDEPPSIQETLAGLSPNIKNLSGGTHKNMDLKNLCCAVDNIFYQVAWGVKKYYPMVEKGDLTIIGAYYDFMNIQKNGPGKIYIINVNGNEIDNSDFTW